MERTPSIISETTPRYQEQRAEQRESWEKRQVWGEDALRMQGETQAALRADRQHLSEIVHAKARSASLRVLPYGLGKLIDRERHRQAVGEENALHKRIFDLETRERYTLKWSVSSMLDETCAMVRSLGEHDPMRHFLTREALSLFQSPEVAPEVAKIMKKDPQTLTLLELQEIFHKRGDTPFSPTMLTRMIVERSRQFRERQQRLDRAVGQYKQELFVMLAAEAAAGRIPVKPDVLFRRLQEVRVYLSDELKQLDMDTAGFRLPYGVIGISDERFQALSEKDLRTLVYHELLHEVSGRVITVADGDKTAHGPLNAREKKSGLRLKGEQSRTKRFEWLNEAITEAYALELSQRQSTETLTSKAYQDERAALNDLMNRGVSREVLLAAYFENIHNRSSAESGGRHFARLIKEAQRVSGEPAILSRIENQFLLRGFARFADSYLYSDSDIDELSALDLSVFRVTLAAGKSSDSRVQEVGYLPDWFDGDYKKQFEAWLEPKIQESGGRVGYTIEGPMLCRDIIAARAATQPAADRAA